MMGSLPIFKTLIDMGMTPFVAAALVVVIVLWTVLLVVIKKFWRYVSNQGRIQARRLQECEDDRAALRDDLEETKITVARLSACQKKGCPMRLPN